MLCTVRRFGTGSGSGSGSLFLSTNQRKNLGKVFLLASRIRIQNSGLRSGTVQPPIRQCDRDSIGIYERYRI